ncbi:unnamed protein product, partial [Prorocentrum cordatum]
EKAECKREFMGAAECCLDPGLGRRLRQRIEASEGREEIDSPGVVAFLQAMWARVVLPTAFVECLFASHRQWLLRSSRPMGIWNIGRRHTLNQHMRACQKRVVQGMARGRQAAPAALGRAMRRCRPQWAHSKRKRAAASCGARGTTGLSCFLGEVIAEAKTAAVEDGAMVDIPSAMADGHKRWGGMSTEAKKKYVARARNKRACYREFGDDLKRFLEDRKKVDADSPLTLEEFAEVSSGSLIQDGARAWGELTGRPAMPDANFPKKVQAVKSCCDDLPECVTGVELPHYNRMKQIEGSIRELVAEQGKDHGPMVIMLSAGASKNVHAQIMSYRVQPFEAEIWEGSGPKWMRTPTLMDQWDIQCHGCGPDELPRIETEREFALRLARECLSEWTVYRVEATEVAMNKVRATKLAQFDREAAAVKQQQERLMANAKKALDMCLGRAAKKGKWHDAAEAEGLVGPPAAPVAPPGAGGMAAAAALGGGAAASAGGGGAAAADPDPAGVDVLTDDGENSDRGGVDDDLMLEWQAAKKADDAQKKKEIASIAQVTMDAVHIEEGGEVFKPDQTKPIGKVYGQRLDTVQASCYVRCLAKGHKQCKKWVMLHKIRGGTMDPVKLWLNDAEKFRCHDSHMDAFNSYVM